MPTARPLAVVLPLVLLALCLFTQVPAQNGSRTKTKPEPISEMRAAIERYTVDRGSLTRSYPAAMSKARRDRFRKFYEEWLASLKAQDFDSMSEDGKVDYVLFKNHLEYELRQLDIQGQQLSEIQPLIPFADTIINLEEARRRMEPINSAKIAATLTELRKQVDESRRAIDSLKPKKTVANRAVLAMNGLGNNLRICKDRSDTHRIEKTGRRKPSCDRQLETEKDGRESRRPGNERPAKQSAELVHVLQRLRSAVHVVERGTLQVGRSGAHKLH